MNILGGLNRKSYYVLMSTNEHDSLTEPLTPTPDECYTYQQASDILGIPKSKVAHLIKNKKLISIKHGKEFMIPKIFFSPDKPELNKHISGLIAVLSDGGFNQSEIISWLFSPQDDLVPGKKLTPAETIHTYQAREVMRIAQSLAF